MKLLYQILTFAVLLLIIAGQYTQSMVMVLAAVVLAVALLLAGPRMERG